LFVELKALVMWVARMLGKDGASAALVNLLKHEIEGRNSKDSRIIADSQRLWRDRFLKGFVEFSGRRAASMRDGR
jgi:hypothetical protein